MTSQRNYRYRLGRIVARCPQCNHREFKPFVDTVTGEILDPTVGRCNREKRCGYVLTPTEFFAATGRRCPSAAEAKAAASRPSLPIKRDADIMSPDMVWPSLDASLRDTPFHRYFYSLFPDDRDLVDRVFTAYRVGVSKKWGGSPIFWLTDSCLRTRSGKIMAYDDDGHRRRDIDRATEMAHRLTDRMFNYEMCFFGENRLTASGTARMGRVIFVESEKTALYLAVRLAAEGRMDTDLPLATGGSGNIAIDMGRIDEDFYRWHALMGRPLILVPDADAFTKWAEAMERLSAIGRSVSIADLRGDAIGDSDDIMDVLLRDSDGSVWRSFTALLDSVRPVPPTVSSRSLSPIPR